jgi:hypothetical protein
MNPVCPLNVSYPIAHDVNTDQFAFNFKSPEFRAILVSKKKRTNNKSWGIFLKMARVWFQGHVECDLKKESYAICSGIGSSKSLK